MLEATIGDAPGHPWQTTAQALGTRYASPSDQPSSTNLSYLAPWLRRQAYAHHFRPWWCTEEHVDYWVDPGDGDNYGAIWVGPRDNVQQGLNEKGLAYDANGLPRVDTNPHPERAPVVGGYCSYPIHILHECATVEEVVSWVNAHQWHSYMHDQMHFADATGDAVIISAGADGEIVFTRKPPGDSFLVSTNFSVANPQRACRRAFEQVIS